MLRLRKSPSNVRCLFLVENSPTFLTGVAPARDLALPRVLEK